MRIKGPVDLFSYTEIFYICKKYNVNIRTLVDNKPRPNLRGEVAYALRTKFNWTWKDIGKCFNCNQSIVSNLADSYAKRQGFPSPKKKYRYPEKR